MIVSTNGDSYRDDFTKKWADHHHRIIYLLSGVPQLQSTAQSRRSVGICSDQ